MGKAMHDVVLPSTKAIVQVIKLLSANEVTILNN